MVITQGLSQAWEYQNVKGWITPRGDPTRCLGHMKSRKGGRLVLHTCNSDNEHTWRSISLWNLWILKIGYRWPFAGEGGEEGGVCASHAACSEQRWALE